MHLYELYFRLHTIQKIKMAMVLTAQIAERIPIKMYTVSMESGELSSMSLSDDIVDVFGVTIEVTLSVEVELCVVDS